MFGTIDSADSDYAGVLSLINDHPRLRLPGASELGYSTSQ